MNRIDRRCTRCGCQPCECDTAGYCPQHGYPLPCNKCGYSTTPDSLLLTEDEIFKVMTRHHNSTLCMDMEHDTQCWEKDMAKAQLAKAEPIIRAETLKEVGKWLEANGRTGYRYTDEDDFDIITLRYDTSCDNEMIVDLGDWKMFLAKLSQGVMPE